MPERIVRCCFAFLLLYFLVSIADAQTTAFTYQGKLTDGGSPANGNYDFQFKLFDMLSGGIQQGTTQTATNVPVANGIFAVSLDFGACASCFNGSPRFLEIAVKPTAGGSFTPLDPRQPITSTPYAVKSLNATAADGLSVACVSCVTSSQIASVSGSAVTGAIPVGSVPAGSANYIQNRTSLQASSNFNISGNGTVGGNLTANTVNATTQFNLNGLRVLTVNGPFLNFTVDFTASNTFAGDGAGLNTQPSFTIDNPIGKFNAFFGAGAGQANTTGDHNAFFGTGAGFSSTTGKNNAFFGPDAGHLNSFGDDNAFFGFQAGSSNTGGSGNTFIGRVADFSSTNSTGDNNTLLGAGSRVFSGSSNATAIGFRAQVTQSNSLILGAINGVNSAIADTNIGIGTTAPGALLDIQRDGGSIPQTAWFTTYGADNAILSRAAGGTRATPAATPSGTLLLQLGATGHNGNGFVTAPRAAIEMTAAEAWAAGATGTLMRFNTTLSGTTQILTRMTIADDGDIGIGTTSPQATLDVNGIIRIATLGAAGATQLCRNASNQIATCSSSLRYKSNLVPFIGGLAVINRLRPISFTWNADGQRDVGFSAEDVAGVEPLLTFKDSQGQVEGVKYDRLSVVFVNAFKEQQAQIKAQEQEIESLKRRLQDYEALKKLVCFDHPAAEVCK